MNLRRCWLILEHWLSTQFVSFKLIAKVVVLLHTVPM